MKTRDDIEAALSLERFAKYLEWADGDHEKALELYTRNAKVSEALYIPLQMLEVSLRNRIHSVMAEMYGDEWFDEDGLLLLDLQKDQLAKAKSKLRRAEKAITAGAIVAELSFGFWTSMFHSRYENLWQQHLKSIAQRPDGKGLTRKAFSEPLKPIRDLRNRVAHHEPIVSWSLKRHYQSTMQLIEWLSPAAAQWTRENSRFDEAHPEDKIL